MKHYKMIFPFLLLISLESFATEGFGYGHIKSLTYRGGWVMFTVVSENNENYCAKCPVDPGSQGISKCWIEESKTAQLSMLLSAQARNKKVGGRVFGLASNCNVYEMTIQD